MHATSLLLVLLLPSLLLSAILSYLFQRWPMFAQLELLVSKEGERKDDEKGDTKGKDKGEQILVRPRLSRRTRHQKSRCHDTGYVYLIGGLWKDSEKAVLG